MLKKIFKKIPGFTFSFRLAYRCAKAPISWFRNYIRRKKRYNIKNNIDRWDFDGAFSDLIKLAEIDHDYVEETGNRLIREDRTNPKGYALIQACLDRKPKEGHYDVGLHALPVGMELVRQGELKEAVVFFNSLQKIFPKIYEPYTLLYGLIYSKQEEYRALPARTGREKKKPLILSFLVWGDKYISFFNDYCIPSMMAGGNLPAVAKIRDISVDIYAHREDIVQIKKQDMFKSFSKLCEIHFIEFPERLVTCEGYKKAGAVFRYNIYGGFHHVSIERARSIGADVICLGSDNIYSDGSFLNYVKFIDNGFSAVLFTSTRAQAEFLNPVLDRMKDPSTKTLSITSDEMVDFSAQFIHHTFLEYTVTDNMTPVWRSAFFIPYKHGFHIRSYHYHPVIISAAAIDRSKDIRWNYTGVDADLIAMLFPYEKDWENIKVITDSRDGIMLDVEYASPAAHTQEKTAFSEEYLDKICGYFNKNNFWNFQFIVDYRMKKEMSGVRGYLYDQDGTLQPREFPLTATIEDVRKRIDDWYNKPADNKLYARR